MRRGLALRLGRAFTLFKSGRRRHLVRQYGVVQLAFYDASKAYAVYVQRHRLAGLQGSVFEGLTRIPVLYLICFERLDSKCHRPRIANRIQFFEGIRKDLSVFLWEGAVHRRSLENVQICDSGLLYLLHHLCDDVVRKRDLYGVFLSLHLVHGELIGIRKMVRVEFRGVEVLYPGIVFNFLGLVEKAGVLKDEGPAFPLVPAGFSIALDVHQVCVSYGHPNREILQLERYVAKQGMVVYLIGEFIGDGLQEIGRDLVRTRYNEDLSPVVYLPGMIVYVLDAHTYKAGPRLRDYQCFHISLERYLDYLCLLCHIPYTSLTLPAVMKAWASRRLANSITLANSSCVRSACISICFWPLNPPVTSYRLHPR